MGELAFRLLRYTTRAIPGVLYARLKRRVIAPLYNRLRGDRLYRTTFLGGPFWLPATSSALNRNILLRGAYEPEAIELFRSRLKPGMTVYDVGANIGYYTVLAAETVGPTGRVFALKPDPRNVEIIHQNLRARRLENVVVAQVAVSDRDGDVDLHFSQNNPSINSLARANTEATGTRDSYSQAVPGMRSTRLSPGIAVSNLTSCKIDVQGAELLAFRGAERLLAAPRLRILLEFWPYGFGARWEPIPRNSFSCCSRRVSCSARSERSGRWSSDRGLRFSGSLRRQHSRVGSARRACELRGGQAPGPRGGGPIEIGDLL